ncbi:MAG: AsmA-like C-terminal domain-containing protein, partial [Planctomycetota bacterium]
GDLQIDEGRLMNLPVLSDLTALIAKVRLGTDQKPNDRAKGAFEFQSDHLHISEMEIISAFIGLRGVGIIYYDSKLDINVKARVMEQLQKELSRLGDIGTIIGALSDKVVTYHVHGTISDPKVTVRPLGIGK